MDNPTLLHIPLEDGGAGGAAGGAARDTSDGAYGTTLSVVLVPILPIWPKKLLAILGVKRRGPKV